MNINIILAGLVLVSIVLISGCIQEDELKKFEADTAKFQEEALEKITENTDTEPSAYDSQMEPRLENGSDTENKDTVIVPDIDEEHHEQTSLILADFVFLDENVIEDNDDFKELSDTEIFGENVHARIWSSAIENMANLLPINIVIEYDSDNLNKINVVKIDNPDSDCYITLYESESGCSKNIGIIQNDFKEGKLVIKAIDKNRDLLAYIEYEDGKVISKEETVPGRDF